MPDKKYQVRIKAKRHHGTLAEDYDPKKLHNKLGPRAVAGETIIVTQAELDAFGDKFENVTEAK